MEIVQRPATDPACFGLSIAIGAPISTMVNVAALLKPLLDGLVTAFHAHNGVMLEQLSQRLGAVLQADTRDIADHLCHQETAVLGQRCLLRPWRQSVQWNPADDRCLAAEVLLRPYAGWQWRLSGMIFAIAGQGQPGGER